ncbi:MAG: transposase [Endomicrobium sp.]|jgi:transposase-like protein|nr:transposase [Endomicrobium sp.]
MKKVYEEVFKARVEIDALKGDKTINELAKEHQVHPKTIGIWKKTVEENVGSLFSSKNRKDKEVAQKEEQIEEVHRQLGKANAGVEFLKKKYRQVYGKVDTILYMRPHTFPQTTQTSTITVTYKLFLASSCCHLFFKCMRNSLLEICILPPFAVKCFLKSS